MSQRTQLLFLLLIAVQVAHSLEEYLTRLYDVLAPARFISGLFSENLALGFAIFNVTVIALGVWCYLGPIRFGSSSARLVVWLWIVIELANAIGHFVFVVMAAGYFPGAVTAVVLAGTAVCLALSLRADQKPV